MRLIAAVIAMIACTVTPASASAAHHHHEAGCSVVIDGAHPKAYHLTSGQSLRFPNLKVFCWRGTVYMDAR